MIHLFAFLGFTIDVIGKVMVAYTAIMVHHRFWQEHRVDDKVFRTMRRERIFGIIGLVLIIIGYFLQVPAKI